MIRTELPQPLNYYDISPKLIPVGKTSTLRVFTKDPSRAYKLDDCIVHVHSMDECTVEQKDTAEVYPSRFINGCIEFDVTPSMMTEYRISIQKKDAPGGKGFQIRFFAIDQDLYERRPYKGDLHVHSTGSDGAESPEIVAANYRSAGFDFFSLTDHQNFSSSQQVHEAYKDVKLGMRLLYGEECHCPGNAVHVVNFGSTESIVEIYKKMGDSFQNEIQQFSKTISIPDEVKDFSYAYASSVWEARKIKEYGGLAIFPHPYWESYAYNVPTCLSRALLRSGEFDAFELLGGQTIRENNYQTLLWDEEVAHTPKLPLVSSSDSHTSRVYDAFGAFFTIVYAKSDSREDLLQAVRDGYCSAVERRRNESYRVYGPLRLGLLTNYLLEYFYPFHDDICFGEGVLMAEYARGENRELAKELLEKSYGRSHAAIDHLFTLS